MTAISLFDVLAARQPTNPGDEVPPDDRLDQLAARLVGSCLTDWQRVRQYESDFTPTNLDNLERVREIDQSIHSLHSQWSAEAQEVHSRAEQQSTAAGHPVPKLDHLADAIGLTRARLLATPEKLVRALEHVKSGQTLPAKELRDELNARFFW